MGAATFQQSIRWWSHHHRSHHRYTDTDKDPYGVTKGLFHSHIGWLLTLQSPKAIGDADISDLDKDPIVRFQHRHIGILGLVAALVVPTFVCGLGWGDWAGGYLYAGVLRTFLNQHCTFCVNSLAHWMGEQPFDDHNSPRDHLLVAVITNGEGYHNFHHEFPSDYRNAIQRWQYDPTKWLIRVWQKMGLAYGLKEFQQNEIAKGQMQQKQKKMDQEYAQLNWGTPLSQLPVIEWDEFVARTKLNKETQRDGEALIVVAGIVHDVADFIAHHPGGKAIIASAIGKDATTMFNGGVYLHSNAAHNLLSTMRIGIVRGGGEVEIWKKGQEDKNERIIRAGDQMTNVHVPGSKPLTMKDQWIY